VHGPLRSTATLCRICGVPLDPAALRFADHCGSGSCRARAALEADRPALERKVAELLAVQRAVRADLESRRGAALTAARDRLAASLGILEARSYELAVVPSNDRALAPLPAERRSACEERLRALVRDIAEPEPEPEPVALPDVPVTVQRGACAMCRGHCCGAGGEHAFLSVRDLRRVLDGHPELTAEDLPSLYLSRLPAVSSAGSCVFHAAQGCALPRELRSAVCNRYLCEGLRELGHALERTARAGAFVASFREAELVEGAFLGEPAGPGPPP
jgi:hypothetical protein